MYSCIHSHDQMSIQLHIQQLTAEYSYIYICIQPQSLPIQQHKHPLNLAIDNLNIGRAADIQNVSSSAPRNMGKSSADFYLRNLLENFRSFRASIRIPRLIGRRVTAPDGAMLIRPRLWLTMSAKSTSTELEVLVDDSYRCFQPAEERKSIHLWPPLQLYIHPHTVTVSCLYSHKELHI